MNIVIIGVEKHEFSVIEITTETMDFDSMSRKNITQIQELLENDDTKIVLIVSKFDCKETIDNCCLLAQSINYEDAIFITYDIDKNTTMVDIIKKHFNHVIYIDKSTGDLDYFVKWFVHDFCYNSYVGVCFEDLLQCIMKSKESIFYSTSFPSYQQLRNSVDDLRKTIQSKASCCKDEFLNLAVRFNVPHNDENLLNFVAVATQLSSYSGNILFSLVIKEENRDNGVEIEILSNKGETSCNE